MLSRPGAWVAALNTRSIHRSSRFTQAKTFNGPDADVGLLSLSEPTVFPGRFADMPAIKKWFAPVDHIPSETGMHHHVNLSYLGRHGELMVPLELSQQRTSTFERLQAPFSLLLSHIQSEDDSHQLYLAQCSLSDLPLELQADLPVPELLSRMGRGDIYASSLWMGRPPTNTPLHRDPNPNLFVQLVGQKVVCLMRPEHGRLLYERLRTNKGHAHMRGEEMMMGEELDRLQNAVWNEEKSDGVSASGVEARLESGDGLFIPLGWWHAVQGYGANANASVNWWFR